jgi:predicted RNase H-like nuclease (RuvC/YqgF family)
MLSVLKQWFGRSPTTQPQDDERLLALQRQIQNLRLELAERNQLVDKLKQELERQRKGESDRLANGVQTQVEQQLSDSAAPVTQLLT